MGNWAIKLALAGAIGAASCASAAAHNVANFSEPTTKKGQAKIFYYQNADIIKTTSTTTKVPVYNSLGHLTGYKTVITKSTAITPKDSIFITSTPTGTTPGSAHVNFTYDPAIAAALNPLLGGTQDALFSLSATSGNAPVVNGGTITQLFGPGSMHFDRATPIGGLSNLLSIDFSSLTLTSYTGFTFFTLAAQTPDSTIVLTSDFKSFSPSWSSSFYLFGSLPTGSSAISIASVSPSLTNVTGARGFNSFRGILLGNVSSSLPEPASWMMMLGGVGLIGGMLRTRRARAAFAA
jgi:hypothetical protein